MTTTTLARWGFNMKQYERIIHAKMNFDEHCKMFPIETIKANKDVRVTKSLIPYCYETSTIVYFVDGTNGDSYGQYATKQEALERYNYLIKLSDEDRRNEDQ